MTMDTTTTNTLTDKEAEAVLLAVADPLEWKNVDGVTVAQYNDTRYRITAQIHNSQVQYMYSYIIAGAIPSGTRFTNSKHEAKMVCSIHAVNGTWPDPMPN